jgi:hypothetical protein
VELSLRIFGLSYRALWPEESIAGFNILCLGNSFTAGSGADPGHSFCDYLQRKIRDSSIDQKESIRIINLGESSRNSAMILRDLPKAIRAYRPRIVLLMTGEPNYWNRTGMNQFSSNPRDFGSQTLNRLRDEFFDMRVVRLFVLLNRSFSANNSSFPELRSGDLTGLGFKWFGLLYRTNRLAIDNPIDQETLAEILKSLKHIDALYGEKNPAISLVIARVLFLQGKKEEGRPWIERSIDLFKEKGVYPYDAVSDLDRSIRLGQNWAKELKAKIGPTPNSRVAELAHKAGTNAFQESLPLNFQPKGGFPIEDLEALLISYPAYIFLRRHLFEFYLSKGMSEKAAKVVFDGAWINPLDRLQVYIAMVARLKREPIPSSFDLVDLKQKLAQAFPDLAASFSEYNFQETENWIRSDLEEIASMLESFSATLVLQTYPPRRNGTRQPADRIILEIAAEKGLMVSDTYSFLEEKFSKAQDRNIFYVSQFGPTDPHLSNLGNSLVGNKLFEELQNANLLPRASGN